MLKSCYKVKLLQGKKLLQGEEGKRILNKKLNLDLHEKRILKAELAKILKTDSEKLHAKKIKKRILKCHKLQINIVSDKVV